jgi:hypothetical protein
MRATWISLVLGCALAGCTSESTPVIYMSLAYQVRCIDCEPRGPDDPAREIKHVDGEDDYDLDCEVRRVDGTRRVTFSASQIDPKMPSTNKSFGIELAAIDEDDSELNCTVNVVESGNAYQGACSSDAPEDSGGPCQVNLRVQKGVIKGGVYCDDLPNRNDPSTARYLVEPSTRSDPATIEIHGCRGL